MMRVKCASSNPFLSGGQPMSKSRNKNTAGADERPSKSEPSISLTRARKMLPFNFQIGQHVQGRWNHLAQLESEQIDLDKRLRGLDWPQCQLRYQVAADIQREHQCLQNAVGELEQLNVVLVDPQQGE